MFFNLNTMFICWMLLELNVLLFVLLLFNWQENPSSQFYYFLVQRFSSFFFLYYAVSNYLVWDRSVLFLVGLFIKCGFFPFYSWYYKFCMPLGWTSLATVLTIQKLPSLIILFRFYDDIFLYLFLINGLFGSILISTSSHFRSLLVSSSIYIGYWMYLLFSFSIPAFYLFYIAYTLTLFFCLYFVGTCRNSGTRYFMLGLLVLAPFLSGLPPFNVFFIKYYLLRGVYMSLGTIQFIFMWRITVISILGYFWFFLKKFLPGSSVWSAPLYLKSSNIFILLRMVFLMSILLN